MRVKSVRQIYVYAAVLYIFFVQSTHGGVVGVVLRQTPNQDVFVPYNELRKFVGTTNEGNSLVPSSAWKQELA